MIKKLLLGAVIGGIVAFGWGALSWMVLPWHMSTMKSFESEQVVGRMLQMNVGEAGVYVMPFDHQSTVKGPFVFAAIQPTGMDNADPMLYVRGLLMQIAGAFLLTWLLLQLGDIGYMKRVIFITLVACIAGVLGVLPNWNWWGFSLPFTLLNMADLVISWFLAGLVIAKILQERLPVLRASSVAPAAAAPPVNPAAPPPPAPPVNA
jgi:hypothetical protein